jgi:hypothetical protein
MNGYFKVKTEAILIQFQGKQVFTEFEIKTFSQNRKKYTMMRVWSKTIKRNLLVKARK